MLNVVYSILNEMFNHLFFSFFALVLEISQTCKRKACKLCGIAHELLKSFRVVNICLLSVNHLFVAIRDRDSKNVQISTYKIRENHEKS